MYRVDTGILSKPDAHEDATRPVVVLAVSDATSTVIVCTRSSQREDGSGVFHPATPQLDLDRDGWFRSRWYQSIMRSDFVAPLVRRLGWLDEATYAAVEEEVS